MYNLVKMDVYRFVKTMLPKLVLILLLIALSIAVLQKMSVQQNGIASVGADEGEAGMSIALENGSDPYLESGMNLAEYMTANGSGPLYTMISGISMILFAMADNKRGYRKNIAGLVGSKGKIYMAKLISTGIFTLLYLVSAYLLNFVCGKIFLGSWLSFGNVLELLRNFFVLFLLLSAFNIIFVGVGLLSASNIFAIIVCFIAGMGILGNLYDFITFGIMKVTNGLVIPLGRYMVDPWLTGTYHVSEDYALVTAISLLWIVVMGLITVMVLRKRDIR